MPSCVLRVSGSEFKVREFLALATLSPLKVYWRGDPGFPESRGPSKISGFNIALSSSMGESIEKQAKQAVRFIRKYEKDMLLIKSLGFKNVVVDFGLYDLTTEEHPCPSYRIPSTFVSLVGGYGFEVTLSFYGAP